MKKGWVGAGLLAVGAVLAATLGTGFVVGGFALIFVGALVLAVALETLVGAAPSTAATPAGPDVDATTPRVGASSAPAS
jgi:hypothetical protein